MDFLELKSDGEIIVISGMDTSSLMLNHCMKGLLITINISFHIDPHKFCRVFGHLGMIMSL